MCFYTRNSDVIFVLWFSNILHVKICLIPYYLYEWYANTELWYDLYLIDLNDSNKYKDLLCSLKMDERLPAGHGNKRKEEEEKETSQD